MSSRFPLHHEHGSNLSPDELLDKFLQYVTDQKLTLYPAQEEAILALFNGDNVILNTPTGSGKSLVALALHFLSSASGRRREDPGDHRGAHRGHEEGHQEH